MGEDSQELARIKKGAGKELRGVGDKPDRQTKKEKNLEFQRTRAEITGLQQDIDERKKYAHRIFRLICYWVVALFILLIAEGLGGSKWLRFSLPQPVILAVIGSTTLNVLGLFYIVAHYLFPDRGRKQSI